MSDGVFLKRILIFAINVIYIHRILKLCLVDLVNSIFETRSNVNSI